MKIFSIEVFRDALNVTIHLFVPTFKMKKASSTNQVLSVVFVLFRFL